MTKVLVIVSSKDVDKALTGLLWAVNALKWKWVEDVEIVFFGPIEEEIAKGNERLLKAIAAYVDFKGKPIACKLIAERGGYEGEISKYVKVEYVGSRIADLIAQGYVPIVF